MSDHSNREDGVSPRRRMSSPNDVAMSGCATAGRRTNVPAPWRRSTIRRAISSSSALRTVARDTPNRTESSRSPGNMAPGPRSAQSAATWALTSVDLVARTGRGIDL